MADDISKTHPYTCNSCAVAFRTGDAQRTHMRTDWHRYNLKRRIADLPPVSSADYNEKVLAAQAATKQTQDAAAYVKECTICGKVYYSLNAYRSHVNSQKHKLRVAAAGAASRSGSVTAATSVHEDEVVTPEVEEEFEEVVKGMKLASLKEMSGPAQIPRRPSAPPPDVHAGPEHPLSPIKKTELTVPLERCLFCNYDSPSLKLSLTHMSKIHGMFIPEQNYLADLEGLIAYFQAKVRKNHECLKCHKLKNNTDGIQTHMRDKGHCKIAFETEEEMIEVGQFYDFSSTYSDDEEEGSDEDMEDAPGAKVDGEDDGWETDSSSSSINSTEITSVPNDDRTESYARLAKHKHHSASGRRRHSNVDGFHSHAHSHTNAVFYDDNEMYLPSGRVAGHRSLKKYFRQNLHAYPTVAERMTRAQRLIEEGAAEDEDMPDADTSASNSTALLRRGEAGMIGVTDAQRRQIQTKEQKARTQAQRQQSRYQAKLERQANSQKHFRDPLLQ